MSSPTGAETGAPASSVMRDAARPTLLRPPALEPLFVDVATLPGVGPAMKAHLGRLLAKNNPRLWDLLSHLPFRRIVLEPLQDANALEADCIVTLEGTIGAMRVGRNRRQPSRIVFRSLGQELDLVFFGISQAQLEKRFVENRRCVIYGRLSHYRDRWQIAHPELVDREQGEAASVLPVYGTIEALPQWRLRRLARQACRQLPALPEWLDKPWREGQGWPSWQTALTQLHRCEIDPADLETSARQRLAFDELLANQLALAIIRPQRALGRSLVASGNTRHRLIRALPFALTAPQASAIEAIIADLRSPQAMRRLLQGDVGAGKTVVALVAMIEAIEAGAQAALMAPTDVLAQQHARTIAALLAPLGIEPFLLTGKLKGAAHKTALTAIADGTARLVIGTHAMFQEAVSFEDLGLIVIDEQHRFGVNQRLKLTQKGRSVDHLLMTATPIPRSLVLSLYGDIDTSKLTGKPKGRQPIATTAMPLERLDELMAALLEALDRGERAYWICPLVEVSDKTDLQAAEARFASLQADFADRVGLIHGRMSAEAKASAMADFAAGRVQLLVATTVIEVGIDVPEATIIIIEHAERFGLAQLHQLRGRVGRGDRASSCTLLYAAPLSGMAKARLKILRESDDGFRIAEEDLRLRGPGEVLGTRQSGLPMFRFADLAVHAPLIEPARTTARDLLADTARHADRINLLLHLFERHDAIDRLAAG